MAMLNQPAYKAEPLEVEPASLTRADGAEVLPASALQL
jgi:hypothetical protein